MTTIYRIWGAEADYEIVRAPVSERSAPRGPAVDHRALLRALVRAYPGNTALLREAMSDHSWSAGALDAEPLIDRVADALSRGDLILLEHPHPPLSRRPPVRGRNTPVHPRLDPRRVNPARSWLELEVVGEAGLAARGTEILVRLADGERLSFAVDASAKFRLDEVVAGSYEVTVVGPATLDGTDRLPPSAGAEVPCIAGGVCSLVTGVSSRVVVKRPLATLLEIGEREVTGGGVVVQPGGDLLGSAPSELRGLAAILGLVRDQPGSHIWITGHGPIDVAADEPERTSERMRNLELLLAGSRDAWAEHSQAHHEPADLIAAEQWVSQFYGWDCDPSVFDVDSNDALDGFRHCYNTECGGTLELAVDPNADDWRAIYDLYDTGLAELLQVDELELAAVREGCRWVEPATAYLGDGFPPEPADLDSFSSGATSRIDIAVLEPGADRYLEGAAPGERLYGEERVFRRALLRVPSELPVPREDTVVQLVDDAGIPIPNTHFRLELPGGRVLEGQLDHDGCVYVRGVPIGAGKLTLIDVPVTQQFVTAAPP